MSYKVAYIGDLKWSLGSIHYHVSKNLDHFNFRFFDWSVSEKVQEGLDWCDLAIGAVNLYELKYIGYNVSSEIIGVFHNDPFLNSSAFNKTFNLSGVKKIYGITDSICGLAKKKYNIECDLMPVGVDTSFWNTRTPDKIETLGFVGRLNDYENTEWSKVKRPDLFEKICSVSNLRKKEITGKHFLCGSYIYKGVDAVLCTSNSEGNPMSFLECAAMKLPFISTKVGIVAEYSSVKTFDSAEEASEILKYLNSDKKTLHNYVNDVYDEVIPEREWKTIADNYWAPAIEKAINKSYKPLID